MSFCGNINNVESKVVNRIPTGIDEVDWLYGETQIDGYAACWGLPEGKMSLWAGSRGVGKSRATIELARSLTIQGDRVLYFQNEDDLGTFAGKVKKAGPLNSDLFFVSNITSLEGQLAKIRSIKPRVIFVDSINQLEEYGSGTKNNIKLIIEGYGCVEGYKRVCSDLDAHVIFIGQLNQDGSVKGSSALPHLVDIVFKLELMKTVDSHFAMAVADKHRYGRTGKRFFCWWRHLDHTAICDTTCRLDDAKWCETHGHGVKNYGQSYQPEEKRSFFSFLRK